LPIFLVYTVVFQVETFGDITGTLSYPLVEGAEQRSVLLACWINLSLLAHVVVLAEMTVKVGFQLLVADEPQTTVGALELDTLVQLGDGDDIELLEDQRVVLHDGEVEQMTCSILRRQTVVDLV
jgi:hypothetical protein